MKLLFCSGNDTFSKLIRFASRSKWSHVGMYFPADESPLGIETVAESICSGGPHIIAAARYNGFNGEVWLASLKVQPDNKKLWTSICWNLGDPYSWAEIVVLAFRLLFKVKVPVTIDRKQFICSEWAQTKLDECGVELGHWNELASPADLSVDPLVAPQAEWVRYR